ncbi:hypothetical protein A3A03_00440 [Candidatus Nomurabacteria bacterium RIFCSPLOWO2_01_FULL_40_18]|uniref:Uncharacterized protein n=1 Tax=Candidatus Nomurabacteria bacterium RIFCSPLOWO2_01_FULL_40_18 TaxID=1801773 RepID=A0A1F6XI18_9BACT|nr:MAG: hypothetical protein A3A03_00440 [Candidatus Nomurabacteria bacterium RIFCSPLOWO2_01_FULL_40_18]
MRELVIKAHVIRLRIKGKTYTEIQNILKMSLPKSTLSGWCKGVRLPKWYKRKIDRINWNNYKKARRVAWMVNKAKRERFLRQLLENIKPLEKKIKDRDVLKMILATLYLGEGTKWKSHSGMVLGSSDPNIILLYIKLLELCYDINRKNLKCRVSYRADQNIKSLEKYWSKITAIPLKNFYKTKFDPRTVGKPTRKKEYKGVCVIMGVGSHIQLELEAIPGLILRGL